MLVFGLLVDALFFLVGALAIIQFRKQSKKLSAHINQPFVEGPQNKKRFAMQDTLTSNVSWSKTIAIISFILGTALLWFLAKDVASRLGPNDLKLMYYIGLALLGLGLAICITMLVFLGVSIIVVNQYISNKRSPGKHGWQNLTKINILSRIMLIFCAIDCFLGFYLVYLSKFPF